MLSPAAAAAGSMRRLTRRRGNGAGRRLDECALLFAKANTLCSNSPPPITGVRMLQSVGEVFKVSMRVCVGARYVEKKNDGGLASVTLVSNQSHCCLRLLSRCWMAER